MHLEFNIRKKEQNVPDSSGLVDEQSASFPGSDDDLNTLFCLTNSLALFAARAA
jgi:hypothetical protein